MFLNKRDNGYWQIIYYNEKGKRTAVSTKTKNFNMASVKFNEFKKDYLLCGKDLFLNEVIEKFLNYRESNSSRSTLIHFKSTLNEFSVFLSNKRIKKIIQEDINNYSIFLFKKKENEPSAINVKMSRVKIFFDFVLKYKYINETFDFAKIRVTEKEREFLTFEEFKKLLQYCKNKDMQDIVVIAFLTGLRISEVVNLTWDNIDFN